jgi:hypothetical protein
MVMETTEKITRGDDDVASDVAAVIDLLPRVLRGKSFGSGFDGLQVSVEEPKPGVVYCVVTINGDNKADRDAIKAKFPKSEGWTCKDKSDKKAVCTNP